MKKRWWILAGVLLLTCCLGGVLLPLASILSGPALDEYGAELAILEVKGPIFDSSEITEKIEKYRKSSSIKAVVIRVDSPGGAVGPSQEIYTEVKKLAAVKVVVVSMGAVAASGGYYISAPATKILANPGTLTGSIGVLVEHVEFNELLKWAKVSAEILKAGELKDNGSPFRPMKPEERKLFQALLDNLHLQFMTAVSEGRKIPLEEVKKIADGRVYSGEQALSLKLIDGFGNLQDAIEMAKKLASLKDDAKVLKPHRPEAILETLFGEKAKIFNKGFALFSLGWVPVYSLP